MKRTWLVTIILVSLSIISIVIYLVRQRADESGSAPVIEARTPVKPTIEPSGASPSLATCFGPTDPQIPKASLAVWHKWADSLLVKGRVDGALTELRNIATIDPAYPAINFEISDALLKSRHAGEAKDAIKLQLKISECVSNLPPVEMQAYCKSEWASEPQGGCVQALAKINQEAQYEAGLIDAGLSGATDPHTHTAPLTSVSAVAPRPIASPATGTVAAVQQIASGNAQAETVVPKPPPPPKIQSLEASEHIGQQATVCGVVASKHTAEESSGKPTFVNLDRSFPNQAFTVVIWEKDSPEVGDFPATGNVCVTGTIATYRGSPQIVVHEAKDWYRSDQP